MLKKLSSVLLKNFILRKKLSKNKIKRELSKKLNLRESRLIEKAFKSKMELERRASVVQNEIRII